MADCRIVSNAPSPRAQAFQESDVRANATDLPATPFDPVWLDRREDHAWFGAAERDSAQRRLIARARRFAVRWQLGPCAQQDHSSIK